MDPTKRHSYRRRSDPGVKDVGTQTDYGIGYRYRDYNDFAECVAKGYPEVLQTMKARRSHWDQTVAKSGNCKDIIECVQLFALEVAVDLHSFFIDKHNQMVDVREAKWQKAEEEGLGEFYHFLIHKESGGGSYALDFGRFRTREWPYGVRVCGVERH